jgi:hypothetical protein
MSCFLSFLRDWASEIGQQLWSSVLKYSGDSLAGYGKSEQEKSVF